MNQEYTARGIAKYAGAFIAWMIGSGFASGQETLQFFTSYGLASYTAIGLNFIGTLFFGVVFVETGYRNRELSPFNHFLYFCGNRAGRFYSGLIAVIVFLLMAVLISGAGATLQEYYGLNHLAGSLLMAAAVLAAYLSGFERLIFVISKVGPAVIAFTLAVGVITAVRDWGDLSMASSQAAVLSPLRTSPHWGISSLLYLSLNFLSGGAYFTQLGVSAEREKDVTYGMIVGIVVLMAAIAIVYTAFLLNAQPLAELPIPILYLAEKISHPLGTAFSIILILGIFSSCSSMMWTVCSRSSFSEKRTQQFFAAGVAAGAFFIGLLPFTKLISVFYPLVGYAGILLLLMVVRKVLREKDERTPAPSKPE